MVQVGKATLDQRADEVQSRRRTFVRAQQELRIGHALGLRKTRAVDEVSAITWQGDAIPGLEVGSERGLAYCPAKRPTRDDRLLAALHQNEAHL